MKRAIYAMLFLAVCLNGMNGVHAQDISLQTQEGMPKSYLYTDTARISAELKRVTVLYDTRQHIDSIFPLLEDVFTASIKAKYGYGLLNSMIILGRYYNDIGNAQKGRAYYSAALLFANEIRYKNDTIQQKKTSGWITHQIALSYFNEGENDSAAYIFMKLIAIADKNKQLWPYINKLYDGLGACYARLNKYPLALYYFKKAVQLGIENKNTEGQAMTLANMGTEYMDGFHDYERARGYFIKSLAYANMSNNVLALERGYQGLGQIYVRMDSMPKAILYLKEASRLSHSSVSSTVYSEVNVWLAIAYHALKQNKLAEKHYLISIQEASLPGGRKTLSETYSAVAHFYSTIHQYEKAYYYQVLAAHQNDTLREQEKKQTVNLEVNYQTANKSRALAQQKLLIIQQENRIKDRNILVTGTTSGILLLGALLGGMYLQNRSKRRLQEKQMLIMQREQELRQMEAHMKGEEQERNRIAYELHDSIMVQFSVVKMNLGILPIKYSVLVAAPEYSNVVKQLDYATKQLRNTAHNLMPDMLAEKGLVAAVQFFCKNLNVGDQLNIEFQHYGSFPKLPTEFELSLYRIIQELLQNVIKHSQAKKALVQLACQEGMLGITVEDNGIGLYGNEGNGDDGIGLKKTRNKVAAMNGRMDFSNTKGSGTTIHLEFDISAVAIKNIDEPCL